MIEYNTKYQFMHIQPSGSQQVYPASIKFSHSVDEGLTHQRSLSRCPGGQAGLVSASKPTRQSAFSLQPEKQECVLSYRVESVGAQGMIGSYKIKTSVNLPHLQTIDKFHKPQSYYSVRTYTIDCTRCPGKREKHSVRRNNLTRETYPACSQRNKKSCVSSNFGWFCRQGCSGKRYRLLRSKWARKGI